MVNNTKTKHTEVEKSSQIQEEVKEETVVKEHTPKKEKKSTPVKRETTKKEDSKKIEAKPVTRKTTEPRKPRTRKTATKTTTKKKKTELFIQFAGYEVSQEDLVARTKEVWVQNGNKVTDIVTLSLYVKPEEYKAYYVINGSFAGAMDL